MAAVDEVSFVSAVLSSCEKSFPADKAADAAAGVDGASTRIRALASLCDDAAKARLLGSSPEEQARVTQWLAVKNEDFGEKSSEESVAKALADLNQALKTRSFLATPVEPSLADYALFFATKDKVKSEMLKTMPGLVRWFDHMQHSAAVRGAIGDAAVKFELPNAWSLLGSPQAGARGLSTKVEQPAAPAKANAAEAQSGANKADQNAKKGGDKAAAAKGGDNKAKQEKKEKKQKQKPAPAADPDQPEATKLDIRVGNIVKCWNHEDSDKLFCEEIDVGEEAPRSIASGLRNFYEKSTDLENRKVLVLCNLKARNIAGFKSHGMVLCASNADHTQVELVDPGADAKIGERVTFEGLEGGPFEPFEPNKIAKKKVFESVAPNLQTDENCCPVWIGPEGKPYKFVTSTGPCSVPTIVKGTVS